MSATILQFPQQGVPCKKCGFVIVLKRDEPAREVCFCCERNIPLPLSVSHPNCPECDGFGRVEMPIIRNDRRATIIGKRWQDCIACGGKGHKE